MIIGKHSGARAPSGEHRLTVFEPDGSGRLQASVQPTEYQDLIEQSYAQQREAAGRLLGRLRAGELSPIGFYLELQRLTVGELATRARVSAWKVRAHLAPRGFLRARVETLQRYALVFDVDVADFFQLLELADGLEARLEPHGERLLQRLRIQPGQGA
ncbi:MAG TPA: hypothetical protein PK668_12045 [Myxococcota bacterium]|nr:hypothetical protein [Myxococcota bacterium]HRY93801.1 hypothetical protein [Myxococcota bacterium]HSA24568.1 hypothetical protein [Myxococcota bacterium]